MHRNMGVVVRLKKAISMRDIFFDIQDRLEAIADRLQAVRATFPRIRRVAEAIIIGGGVIFLIVVAFLIGCAVQDDIAPPSVTPQPASWETG